MPQDPVFAYGTLTFDRVVVALIGRVPPAEKAVLEGVKRVTVPGKHYPALIKSAATKVEGVLYHGLSHHEFEILDKFEGEEYKRAQCHVMRSLTGDAIAASIWLFAQPDNLAQAEDWNPERFEREHMKEFLMDCRHWREVHSLDPETETQG